MEVSCRQQILLTGFYPPLSVGVLALGAMTVAAGVVTYPMVITVVALIQMATQIRGSAMLYGIKGS